jgi:hypothetical protein
MMKNTMAVVRRIHGRTVEDAPRWAVVSAYAASLVVLPSCLWRIALGLGAPIGPLRGDLSDARGDLPAWVPMWGYTIFLSVLSEALAFLAVGLVARWGEVVPRWIPGLAGRRVPVPAAAVPAGAGAAVLTIGTITSLPGFNEFNESDGTAVALEGWRLALFVVSYGPLVFWGPLLATATVAYCLRRRGRPSLATA